jgi:hypothetical protein
MGINEIIIWGSSIFSCCRRVYEDDLCTDGISGNSRIITTTDLLTEELFNLKR